MGRIKEVIKVSFVGIFVNLVLVIFKAIVGFFSGSIAITMDAINNLSDAISSIITMLGMYLSNKAPNKKHPYGYGKIEYVTSLLISMIIIYTGILAFKESFIKIFNPVIASYTNVMFVIIFIGVATKLVLGKYYIKKGKKLNSDALSASGIDAIMDAVISLSTLIGALITYFFGFSIDGILGVIISILILKYGIEILMESFNNIIGKRIDNEFTKKIKESINKYEEVYGTYDLILNQYGPEKIIGATSIEVSDKLTAKQIHLLTRKISQEIFENYGVILTIGIYASNEDDEESAKIKNYIIEILKEYENVSQIHGYYIDTETNTISFDLIFDFVEKNSVNIKNEIIDRIKTKYPKYSFNVIIDNDFSD